MSKYIFTDGATFNNGKKLAKSAIGVYFGKNDTRNISRRVSYHKQTNQISELLAIEAALLSIEDNTDYILYTDSMYSINCLTKWYKDWLKNGWLTSKKKPVLNSGIIKNILELLEKKNIIFKHVRAHAEKPLETAPEYFEWYGNDQADKLAKRAIYQDS